MSGITWAGGDSYYMVADNADNGENGLYPLTVKLAENGLTITESPTTCATNEAVKLVGTSDLEGVAWDPASGHIFAADESKETIREYDVITGAVISEVTVPSVVKNYNRGNFGMESLTISGDGLTLWTANEEALLCDGARSSPTNTTTVRLVKYTRPSVYDRFELAAMYPYTTEKWHYGYAYKTSSRRGVSDLVALPNGGLIVLERDLSTTATDSAWGAEFFFGIFYVENPEAATDVQNFAALTNTTWSAVAKTKLVEDFQWANYEGICLGPRLENGDVSLLMIAEGVNSSSAAAVRPLVLSGLDIHTLSFAEPGDGLTASIVGSPYRFMAGDEVTVALSGEGVGMVAYTNDAAKTVSAKWSLPAHDPSAGEGTVATFAVAADDSLSWSVKTGTASTPIKTNDSFEPFGVGSATEAMNGWSGDGEVVAAAYTPPQPPGYVMQRETHAQVLDVDDGEAAREVAGPDAAGMVYDCMVEMRRPVDALSAPASEVEVMVAADMEGYLNIWDAEGWHRVGAAYPNGEWIRVRIEFRNDTEFRVRVNGSVVLPEGYGSAWRRAAGAGTISTLAFTGGRVDDVLVTTPVWTEETSGPTATNGIAYAWFDGNDLPREPAMPAPNYSAYTLADLHDAGLAVDTDEPFAITSVARSGEEIELTVNGYKGERPASGYRIYASPTPDFANREDVTTAGEFTSDPADWSTSWRGSPSADARFFSVVGER